MLSTWPFKVDMQHIFTNDQISTQDNINAIKIIFKSHRTIRDLTVNLDLLLNSLVFIDLYLTMKNPFFQREKRKKWFFLIALISMITLLTYDIIHYISYSGSIIALVFNQMTEDNSPYEYYARIFVVIYVIYCFFKVVIMLMRQGTSRNLKIKIVWRHLIY